MTPDEFTRKQEAKLAALRVNREADCTRITMDLIAQVRLRVQTSGQDFNEQPFSPYTPGYGRQRAKAGYQVDYVDFTRTGRLWASVRPETITTTEDTVTIEVAARTEVDNDKLRGARRKRGNILLPAESEIEIARAANRERILKYIL